MDDGLPFGDDFRTILVEQPRLSTNERLPSSLALNPDEIALSRQEFRDSLWAPDLDLYINSKHGLMVELLVEELDDTSFTFTHGTSDTYRRGCRGPMCRRALRVERSIGEAVHRAYKGQYGHCQTVDDWRRRVRQTGSPQYTSVDPLTVAYTVLSHRDLEPSNPSKDSKDFLTLTTNELLYRYLRQEYPNLVR
jgi:hypothetical protein